MEKLSKILLFFISLLSLSFFLPINVSAAYSKTEKNHIKSSTMLSTGNVSFTNEKFYDHSQLSNSCNGITGTLYNDTVTEQTINIEVKHIIIVSTIVIFLLISYWLWIRYGKDEQVVETIGFYPPQGFNSLEVGFLYKGRANEMDVISLLIYLANKGYIKITEIEQPVLFGKKKSFKITKLKEYDGNNIDELTFLNDLFQGSKKLLNQNNQTCVTEVTEQELEINFYGTTSKIIKKVNSKNNKNKVYEKSSSTKKIYIFLMLVVTYILILIPISPMASTNVFISIITLPLPIFGIAYMAEYIYKKTLAIYTRAKPLKEKIMNVIFCLFLGVIFGLIPWLYFVYPELSQDVVHFVIYIIGVIAASIMTIILTYMKKRTSYGNEMLGKIYGFKTYIKTAKKTQLEAMVMNNPNYFYDILPYAYVLGISDKWFKKFESITIQPPSWYVGKQDFSMTTFNAFMNKTMSTLLLFSRPSGD